ncbi:NUDIX hydrolase [Peribacillus sp. SCS-26]|uniref:NUDIX hydrolase n=1 Tax=Paraperibacillus marinus TaxID=3115295 RepID=UPI00390577A5
MFIVNVEGAINKDGKWLIIERGAEEDHAAGTLSLVGGKVEDAGTSYEILEETVKREIHEEVGIQIKDELKYVYSSSFAADDGSMVINTVFLCEYYSGEAFRKSPQEVGAIYWMSTKDVLENGNAPGWTKESIRRAGAMLPGLT